MSDVIRLNSSERFYIDKIIEMYSGDRSMEDFLNSDHKVIEHALALLYSDTKKVKHF